jgi:uncharacterized tellurite resistance protein B-like protein
MEGSRDDRLRRLRNSAETWMGTDDPSVETGAMIETAFLMAAADGDLSDAEHEQLCATIAHITSGGATAEQIEGMVDQLVESLHADGWDTRIGSVAKSLADPIARRNAYRLAAGVSFVDGEVQEAEARLFGLLAEAFQIPTEEASQILVEVRDELFADTGEHAKP